MSPVGSHGACCLQVSGSNLKLICMDGNACQINGTVQAIPSAGVTLGTTGLSASTTYFIYAYMDGSTMKLEASTTGHVTDTASGNEGIECKSGDSTRSLVGMARTNGSTQWVDSPTEIFCLSWFHRRRKFGVNAFTEDRSTTSTSFTEINSEIRINFLSWGDIPVGCYVTGPVKNNTAGFSATTGVGIDSTSAPEAPRTVNSSASAMMRGSVGLTVFKSVSEGHHYATVLGHTESGSTSTWLGQISQVNDQKVHLQVVVAG